MMLPRADNEEGKGEDEVIIDEDEDTHSAS